MVLVLGDCFVHVGFSLVVVFFGLVPNTFVLTLIAFRGITVLPCVSCVLWLNSLGHCVVPITCESSVLLKTVVYFVFCTSICVSIQVALLVLILACSVCNKVTF